MDDEYREYLRNYRLKKRKEMLDGLKCDCCGEFPTHRIDVCGLCYKKLFGSSYK
jgi:hypothetical protein